MAHYPVIRLLLSTVKAWQNIAIVAAEFFFTILVRVHASVTFVTRLSGADGHLSAARSNDLLSKWLALEATKTTNS